MLYRERGCDLDLIVKSGLFVVETLRDGHDLMMYNVGNLNKILGKKTMANTQHKYFRWCPIVIYHALANSKLFQIYHFVPPPFFKSHNIWNQLLNFE